MSSCYDFLDNEMWDRVVAVLSHDLGANNEGICFCSPEFPDKGEEMTVTFGLDTRGLNWTGDRVMRELSAAIIADNLGEPDELRRATASLKNTAAIIDAYIAARFRVA